MAALGPPPPPVPAIFSSMEEGPTPGGGAPGEAWLEAHGRALGHWVAGTWLTPPGRGTLPCREAATGRLLATVPRGEEPEVAAAVEAAAAAAEEWGRLGGPRRGQRLQRLAAALEGGAGALGALAALSGGRPLPRCLGADLRRGLRLLRAAAGGAQLDPPALGGWAPLGVVAVVTSGPCSLVALLGKLGALLAMGNAALVLPSPEGALVPLLLGELGGEAGGGALPPGVLNVVSGTPPLRRALRAHPRVGAVVVLGAQQEEAQDVAWGSPWRGPRLGGARGGRLVAIVLDSADLDSAAAAIAGSAATPPPLLPWGGCVVLAQEGVAAALGRRLRVRLGGLRIGDPLEGGTQLGPLPPPAAPPQLEELLQAAREEGAEVFQPPTPLPPGGRFYPPTLITGVAPTSRCLREPVEGPLLALLPVRSPGEAVTLASGLPHAAAAAVWAQDLTLALDVADRLPLGLVWLNALDPLDPAGCTILEELREFGRPPWDPPPEPPQELSPEPVLEGGPAAPPDSSAVAAALEAARRAAPGWGRLAAVARAQVLRGAAAALGGGGGAPGTPPPREEEEEEDGDGRLRAGLLRWAAHVELRGGVVQEVPGGRALVTRRPLGVVGVAWSGPRPLPRALELLPPALALGNGLVLVAPPSGLGPALRLRQALVGAGLPGGALAVLPGGAAGATLARHRPDALWLCGGGGADPDWASAGRVAHLWVPGGVLGGGSGRDPPPPGAERELELRCTLPRCVWVPSGEGGA